MEKHPSHPPAAPEPDEWIDLAPLADVAVWTDLHDATAPPPEQRACCPLPRMGFRIIYGDTWDADYIRVEHADGTYHYRVVRAGDSRGLRYGAKRDRRARSPRRRRRP